jgi:hypothetical protein
MDFGLRRAKTELLDVSCEDHRRVDVTLGNITSHVSVSEM